MPLNGLQQDFTDAGGHCHSDCNILRLPFESHVLKDDGAEVPVLLPVHAQPVLPGSLLAGAGNMAVCLRLSEQAGITNALAVSLSLSPASPPPSQPPR